MVTGYTKNNLQQFWKTLGPCWAAVCAAANVVVGPMASEPFGNIELNLEALSVIFFFCSGVEGFPASTPEFGSSLRFFFGLFDSCGSLRVSRLLVALGGIGLRSENIHAFILGKVDNLICTITITITITICTICTITITIVSTSCDPEYDLHFLPFLLCELSLPVLVVLPNVLNQLGTVHIFWGGYSHCKIYDQDGAHHSRLQTCRG